MGLNSVGVSEFGEQRNRSSYKYNIFVIVCFFILFYFILFYFKINNLLHKI